MNNLSFVSHDTAAAILANFRRYFLAAVGGALVVIVVALTIGTLQFAFRHVTTATVAGIVVLALLVIVFLRLRRNSWQVEYIERRRSTARVVSRAEYVESVERIPVVLSYVDDTIYYENPDLDASLEISRIDDIEIDRQLATGVFIERDRRVIRLRSHGVAFEFIVDERAAEMWRPFTFRQDESYNVDHMLA